MDLSRSFVPLILVLAFALGGCATARHLGGVTVSLVEFRPSEASLLENKAELTVRYTNETISPLGFSSSRHKLFLNGEHVGQVVSDRPFGVPPVSSVTHDVTLDIENVAQVRQLLAGGPSQTVSYRLESELFQTVYEEKYEIKTRAEGVIDLKMFAGSNAAN